MSKGRGVKHTAQIPSRRVLERRQWWRKLLALYENWCFQAEFCGVDATCMRRLSLKKTKQARHLPPSTSKSGLCCLKCVCCRHLLCPTCAVRLPHSEHMLQSRLFWVRCGFFINRITSDSLEGCLDKTKLALFGFIQADMMLKHLLTAPSTSVCVCVCGPITGPDLFWWTSSKTGNQEKAGRTLKRKQNK